MDAQTGLRRIRIAPDDVAATVKVLERLIRTAQRAADIMQRTRDKIVIGRRPVETLDLCDLICGTRDLLADDLRRWNAVLRVNTPDTLPRVRGDTVELQQVLINLVRNAG